MASEKVVTPVKTGDQGIHKLLKILDSGFRRNDEKRHFRTFYEFNILHPFSFLKKWCSRLIWGPGARTERAGSIGWVAPWPRRLKLVSAGGGGGYLPRPIHGETSALWFQADRSGPRALEALDSYDTAFFKERNCYKIFLFRNSHIATRNPFLHLAVLPKIPVGRIRRIRNIRANATASR